MNISDNYLLEYRDKIKKGEIVAGEDMKAELDNLAEDMVSGEYVYDRSDALLRIDFIENCVRLTKSPFYGKPFKLLLWQKAFIEAVYSFKLTPANSNLQVDRFQEILLLISRKCGKALALDTPIPTPDGWKQMKDIGIGSMVFGKDGKPAEVIAESPIFEKPMYRIAFEDGTYIDASEDHIWTVQTKTSRNTSKRKPLVRKRTKPYLEGSEGWYNITTADMVKDFAHKRKDGKGTEYKYRVPMQDAVEYPRKHLPVDPYTLGVWLGDGCKNYTGITCGDEDLDEMIKLLTEEGHCCHVTSSEKRASIVWIDTDASQRRENKTLKGLKALKVFKNKHIPKICLESSIDQRLALLQGLMDTDGTCAKNGECEFTQKSKELAEQFIELVRSLGLKATIRSKRAFCDGKDCGEVYRVIFFTDKNFPCFRLSRKKARLKDSLAPRMKAKSIINIELIETRPSKCIAVANDDHLYLAGKAFTPTHNTETIAALQLAELIIGGKGLDIVCSGQDDGTADLAYQAIDTMRLLIDPKSVDTWRNQKGIKCLANNNHIYKLSDSTRQKEGRNIDIAGIDEVWSLQDGGIYKTIQQSTSTKDRFKIFLFGSEGFIDGFLDQKREEFTKIAHGEDIKDSSKRKLPWLYTQDTEAEVWNTNADGISKAWEKSNPSLGTVKKYDYLRDRVDEARQSKADRIFVLAKDFNIKQNAAEAWLNIEDYSYASSFKISDFRGVYCIGAVDLAETTDLCAAKVLMMKPNDPRKYIYSHYFIPETKITENDDASAGAKYKEWAEQGLITVSEGNDIDLSIVADWFYSLYTDYGIRVWKVGYDQKFAKDWISKMEGYGWSRSGGDQADLVMILQNAQTLSNAIKLAEADFKKHLIYYNDNPVDRWNFGNAGIEIKDATGQALIVKMQFQKKIDGAVCLAIAYETYRRFRSDFKILVEKLGG